MLTSFTSTDSESEITPGGNPTAIQNGRKPLYAVLVKSDQGLLAPVFDSLLTFAEAVLGRPLLAGNREEPSSDEVLIARMIAGTSAWRKSLRCTQCQAALFDCALCSIRHVIAQIDLMRKRPASVALQHESVAVMDLR
jgi:hypothetical protein